MDLNTRINKNRATIMKMQTSIDGLVPINGEIIEEVDSFSNLGSAVKTSRGTGANVLS